MTGYGGVLRVLGWDHPRCALPLAAAAAEWTSSGRSPVVRVTARPLASFNDQPLSELAGRYDVVVVDYPHMGSAAASGVLVPLDEVLPAPALAAVADDAIGGSYRSFTVDGRPWALPVDAACQLGAARADLVDAAAVATWEGLLDLAQRRPGAVALPLYHSDALCCLLTLVATMGAPAIAGATLFEDSRAAERALELLATLTPLLHPVSFDHQPPAVLDHAVRTDEILAVPLTFGYSDYSRPAPSALPRLRFSPPPGLDGRPGVSILGGAGVAVLAGSPVRDAAAAFAAWLAAPPVPRDVLASAGGQPASRQAWADPAVDAGAGGFFSATLAAQERAWVRPSAPWWPGFFAAAGARVAAWLVPRRRRPPPPAELLRSLDETYERHLDRTDGGLTHVH